MINWKRGDKAIWIRRIRGGGRQPVKVIVRKTKAGRVLVEIELRKGKGSTKWVNPHHLMERGEFEQLGMRP